MPKRTEMALPVLSFLEMSPDVAMLFAPFGCTHPPPPIVPKDIAGSESGESK